MSETRGGSERPRINTTWPPKGQVRRTVLGLAAATAAAGTIMVLSAAGAGAAPSKAGVTLCHATASVQQPYVTIHVAENSINQLIFGKNGHASHIGPIFDPAGGKDQPTWGDIIPAFDWVDGNTQKHYDGLNVPAGQAILDNGCAIPEEVSSPPSSPTPSIPESTPPSTPPSTPESTPPTTPSHSISASSAHRTTAAATSSAPIPAGVSAGLHTPIANAGLKAWGTVLMLLGGAAGLLAGLWPTRRRVH